MFGGWHWKIDVIVHAPDVRQHAPRHGFGEQAPPGAGIVEAGQAEPANRKHDPSSRQQAICTLIGHGIGPHTPPGAGVVPAGQAVPMKLKHVPSASQQATKHGLGVHEVAPATVKPWHTVPSGMMMQDPSGRQQTCVFCGQLFGEQVPPGAGVVPAGQAEP